MRPYENAEVKKAVSLALRRSWFSKEDRCYKVECNDVFVGEKRIIGLRSIYLWQVA